MADGVCVCVRMAAGHASSHEKMFNRVGGPMKPYVLYRGRGNGIIQYVTHWSEVVTS